MTVEQHSEEFIQGFGAFRVGIERKACPFKCGYARRQWFAGWQEAARRTLTQQL